MLSLTAVNPGLSQNSDFFKPYYMYTQSNAQYFKQNFYDLSNVFTQKGTSKGLQYNQSFLPRSLPRQIKKLSN